MTATTGLAAASMASPRSSCDWLPVGMRSSSSRLTSVDVPWKVTTTSPASADPYKLSSNSSILPLAALNPADARSDLTGRSARSCPGTVTFRSRRRLPSGPSKRSRPGTGKLPSFTMYRVLENCAFSRNRGATLGMFTMSCPAASLRICFTNSRCDGSCDCAAVLPNHASKAVIARPFAKGATRCMVSFIALLRAHLSQ